MKQGKKEQKLQEKLVHGDAHLTSTNGKRDGRIE